MSGAGDEARHRLQSFLEPAPASFDPDTLTGLPAPARRFLARALPGGTPLARSVDIEATGRIRLGSAWWRFRSRQVLCAGLGFVWQPTVRRGPLRVTGADTYVDGAGTMAFRLYGLIPVAQASGPDTDRSAAGRLAAETVAWLPQACAPQSGAAWSAIDDHRAKVTVPTPAGPSDVTVTVDDDGRLRATWMMRWSDAASPPAERPFGGPVTAEHTTAAGVRIAGDGAVGWEWDSRGWADGEFFHYHVDAATHR